MLIRPAEVATALVGGLGLGGLALAAISAATVRQADPPLASAYAPTAAQAAIGAAGIAAAFVASRRLDPPPSRLAFTAVVAAPPMSVLAFIASGWMTGADVSLGG